MFTRRGSCHVLGIAVRGLSWLRPATAQAHFVLQSPAALTEQNGLGDPQKAPPCGDNGNAVATGIVTSYQAGDVVTITIEETIFHPGHYRVALAMNDISELPEEPPVTPNNTDCGTAPIANPPVFPVLADGIFLHDQATATAYLGHLTTRCALAWACVRWLASGHIQSYARRRSHAAVTCACRIRAALRSLHAWTACSAASGERCSGG